MEHASAVVTGGASGLGFSTANELIRRGFAVLVLDRSADGLRDAWPDALVVSDTPDHNNQASQARVHARAVDVTDADAVHTAISAFLSHVALPLRVAVNCAGVAYAERLLHGRDRVHDTNAFDVVMKVRRVQLAATFCEW